MINIRDCCASGSVSASAWAYIAGQLNVARREPSEAIIISRATDGSQLVAATNYNQRLSPLSIATGYCRATLYFPKRILAELMGSSERAKNGAEQSSVAPE